MATRPLGQSWTSYRARIAQFYDVTQRALDIQVPLSDAEIDLADTVLDAAAVASQELRVACVDRLESSSNLDAEEVETLLVAAAALDAMLAADGLTLDPEWPGRDEQLTEGAGFAEREADARDDMIAAADHLFEGFLGISGAADPASHPQLLGVCLGAVDTLISSASKPALRFTFHGFAAPIAGFATETLVSVTGLGAAAGRIRGSALRMLAEALQKLVAITGHSEIEAAIDRAFEMTDRVLSNVGVRVLGWVAGGVEAQTKIKTSIYGAPGWSAGELASVNREMNQLVSAYANEMKWAGRVATGIARAAPAVSVLAPAGAAIVVGVNAIGVGFVGYTLTVRVGARAVPHPRGIAGAVGIVERRGS